MSRIDQIDTAALRTRLAWALNPEVDRDGSLYLLALGACYLACSTAEEEERLEELFYGQARFELVDGDGLLSTLILAGGS